MSVIELDTSGIVTIRGLTPAHLERRADYLTASDVPAVCGLIKQRTPADVYLRKIGALTGDDGSEPAAIGTALEPGLRTLTEAVLGVGLTRRGCWNTKGRLGATLDDVVANDRRKIVQYKTTGRTDDWDEGPPPAVLVQVQAEIVCAEADSAYVSVLHPSFGPLKFRMFLVERDDDSAAGLLELAETFMDRYVDRLVMPPNSLPSMPSLRRIVRTANKVVPVSDAGVIEYQRRRLARLDVDRLAKGAKELEEEALRLVLTEMGYAEAGESGAGTLTYLEQNRKGYTVAPTSYRVAKFTPRALPDATAPARPALTEVSDG